MGPCWTSGSLRQGCLGGCRPPERCPGHCAKGHRLLVKNYSACVLCGGVTLSCECPHCNCFTLEGYTWWVSSGHRDGSNNLVNAPKLLANQRKDGDSPIECIVTGLHEKRRKGIMDGLRDFIEVDHHSAVDGGGFRRGAKPVGVKRPQFSEASPEAVIREGADELTLRAGEVGSLRTCAVRRALLLPL